MFALTQQDVEKCINTAVPHIANHIIDKANRNNGFDSNPRAIHPVTKVLTLGLDINTRASIEMELMKATNLPTHYGMSQIAFIRHCMEIVTEDIVNEAVGFYDADDVWTILEDTCGRDGALFLATVANTTGPKRDACERFFVSMGGMM